MTLFQWSQGRQGGKYKKMPLLLTRWFDVYILAFEPGFALPLHVDEVKGKRHYRLNVLLRGDDAYIGDRVFKWRRVIIFRADQIHGTKLITRKRTLLSIGWAIKESK